MKYIRFIDNFFLDTSFARRQLNKVEVIERLDKNISQTAHPITDTLQYDSIVKKYQDVIKLIFSKGYELLSLA